MILRLNEAVFLYCSRYINDKIARANPHCFFNLAGFSFGALLTHRAFHDYTTLIKKLLHNDIRKSILSGFE
jgi:hypothetical protein